MSAESGITIELAQQPQNQPNQIQQQQPLQVFVQPQPVPPTVVLVQPPPPVFKTLIGVDHAFTITVPDDEWGDFTFTKQIQVYCVDQNTKDAKEPKQKLILFNFTFKAQFDRNSTLDYVLLKPDFKAAAVAALNASFPGQNLVPVSYSYSIWNGARFRNASIYLIKESTYDSDYPLCCCCFGIRSTRASCIAMWAISPLVKFWAWFIWDIRGKIDNKKWQQVAPTIFYFPEKSIRVQNLNMFTKLQLPKNYENLQF